MTTTMPPNTPGSRRIVPPRPTPRQRQLLADLLGQGKRWILRGDWRAYLDDGLIEDEGWRIESLSRDQRVAARSWLSQQQHQLYAVVQDGPVAPEGWLEATPLYQALEP
jgi:hypothetical protein